MLLHDLKAQETFKRAAEIAVAGGHYLNMVPLDGIGYGFDRALLDRLECRAQWEKYNGEPWSIRAAKDEIAVCDKALATLRATVFSSGRIGGEIIEVAIQPLSWADMLLPPPAEPHERVALRIAKAQDARPAIDAVTPVAMELLKSWSKYHAGENGTLYVEIAKTIAALSGALFVDRVHMAEALSYRPRS